MSATAAPIVSLPSLTVTFTYQGREYTARPSRNDEHTIVYRETAHLGGPWTDALKSANNMSLALQFRRTLHGAMERIYILRRLAADI